MQQQYFDSDDEDYWIGILKSTGAPSEPWVDNWVTDAGPPASFLYWDPVATPDPDKSNDDACAVLHTVTDTVGSFQTRDCENTTGYICQTPGKGPNIEHPIKQMKCVILNI